MISVVVENDNGGDEGAAGPSDSVVVLRFPLPEPQWPTSLTIAEREVAVLLLDGATNAAIANMRGTSRRTVTNQVASIFRKAGVASRIELASRVFG